MPVVLELGKILGGFFAAIVACALGPAAGFNSPRKARRRLRSAPFYFGGKCCKERHPICGKASMIVPLRIGSSP